MARARIAVFVSGGPMEAGKVKLPSQGGKEIHVDLVDAIVKAKPSGAKGKYLRKVALSSSMGPGLKVDLSEVEGA